LLSFILAPPIFGLF